MNIAEGGPGRGVGDEVMRAFDVGAGQQRGRGIHKAEVVDSRHQHGTIGKGNTGQNDADIHQSATR